MTTDAKVQIGLSTDYLEGTAVDTPAGVNLFREGVVLSDPEVAEARAKIVNTTPSADDYALAVRIIGGAAGGGLTDQQLRATPVAVDTEADTKTLNTPLVDADKGLVTNGTLHGKTGAGAYVGIGATTEGQLLVDASGSSVSVANFPATQAVSGTVNAVVQGVPFVQANDLDIRNLNSNVDSVTVVGNVEIANDAGNPIPVTGTVFIQNVNDIEFSANVIVDNFPAVQQVSGTVALDPTTLAALENTTVTVANFPTVQAVSGTVAVNNFPAVQAVSATDLDIRNLSSAQDSVTVTGSVNAAVTGVVTAYSALVPVGYDAIELSYTGDNLTGVVYKQMGATMATLTLGYMGDKLISVART